jgi:predicted ATPase/DNA-binding CsgD family transcriptional regulator
MSDSTSQSPEPFIEPLTRREREILTYLAEGFSAPEIAEQLTLAVSSVKFHIQNVYAKLGANSKRQALTRASELGLLDEAPGAAAAASRPEARSGPALRHNLPLQVTQFFGREEEIAQLKQRLAAYRLVTLSGSGGVGKTRLSLQAAAELMPEFPDGVWLIELAPLTDAALVPQQVATALGVRDEPGRQVLETLTAHLRGRHLLLVLDNCEHLLEPTARLAETLLRACPKLRLLASSREPLGIPGEAVFPIPSLPFPDPQQVITPDALAEYAAVRLFVDRARMGLPGFELTAQNAPAVTRICQRLDGIPLAIEMAAARLNILSAEQLAGRLDDVFRVLTGGSRTALPRQQTLRATVDWSYKLLNRNERLLLQRLSVFAGGWRLEAAEAVCVGEGIDAEEVLDLLGALVTKSMVIADRSPGEEPRYRLLETVRQYAGEKLQDTDDGARLRTQHRDYFLTYAEAISPKIDTAEKFIWTSKLKADIENFRLALHWSFDDSGEPATGPRLILALPYVFSFHEALDWLIKSISVSRDYPKIPGNIQARILGSAAAMVSLNDPPTGLIWHREAVEISRGLGADGQDRLMWSLIGLAYAHEQIQDVEQSMAPYAEAEAILNGLDPGHFTPLEWLRVRGLFATLKANILNARGLHQDAKVSASESIRLYEESGNWWHSRSAQVTHAIACLNLGEFDQARHHLAQAMQIDDVTTYATKTADELHWLAMLEYRQGNLEQALAACRESIRQADNLPDRNIIARCLGILAAVWAKMGHPDRAALLSGAAEAMGARQKRKPLLDSSLDTLLPGWRERDDQAAISAAFEAGQALTNEQAVAVALDESVDP